jgi:hypothetical protein
MSVLTIVQSACLRLGLTSPNAVATSTDSQYLQLLELLNEEAKDLSKRTEWQFLLREASFTTVATEIQGTVSTIMPGMSYIINDTIWNRTIRRPVFGPLGAQYWQQQKAMFTAGPWNQYRIKQNNLVFFPAPAAGQSCYFEYVSDYYATDSTGATPKEKFTADSDLSLHDEEILTLGLVWRWKANKGLDYGTDNQKYETQVIDAIGRNGAKPILNMGEARYDIFPAVVIPSGSWGV